MSPEPGQDRCVIEFCADADVPTVMAFIGEWWRKGHILARDRLLFDWQYRRDPNDRYNVVLAKVGGEVAGVLGFVPVTRFDPAAEDTSIWLALWKVRPDVKIPGLGMRMRSFLVASLKPRLIACGGINPATFGLYAPFRYVVSEFQHYFIVNEALTAFKALAASHSLGPSPKPMAAPAGDLVKLTPADLPALANDFAYQQPADLYPRKSVAYFAGRYTNHPYYDYDLHTLVDRGRAQALFAVRAVSHAGATVLRIVDFVGPEEALAGIGVHAQQLLQERGAEYIDLLNYGIAKETFARAGFRRLGHDDLVTLPQYWEPFEPRNVTIHVALKLDGSGRCWMFKGDGDQDRPNHQRPQE